MNGGRKSGLVAAALLALLGLCALSTGLAGPVAADQAQVTLQAVPSSPVAQNGVALLRIIVHNGETAAISGVTASVTVRGGTGCLTDAGAQRGSGTCSPAPLAVDPGADGSWDLTISGIDASSGAEAQVVASYVLQTQPPVSRLAYLIVTVPPATEALASFSLESQLTSLSEGRCDVVYISVKNTSNSRIRRVEVSGWSPVFVGMSLGDCPRPGGSASAGVESAGSTVPEARATAIPLPAGTADVPGAEPNLFFVDGADLAPNAVRAYRIGVSTDPRILPGTGILAFQIVASDGERSLGTLLTRQITIGVYGESAILGLIAVPILLLVPGFIFMVVLGALASRVLHYTAVPGKLTDAGFWVLAFPVSLIFVVLVYPYATSLDVMSRLVGGRRDVMTAYDVNDIGLLWGMALVAAVSLVAGVWAVSAGIRIARVGWARLQDRRHNIQPNDDPLTVLRKLADKGLDVYLWSWKDAAGRSALRATQNAPTSGEAVMFPQISIGWPSGVVNDEREDIEGQLTESGTMKTLFDLVRKARRERPSLALKWMENGYVPRAQRRDVAGLTAGGTQCVAVFETYKTASGGAPTTPIDGGPQSSGQDASKGDRPPKSEPEGAGENPGPHRAADGASGKKVGDLQRGRPKVSPRAPQVGTTKTESSRG
jgi:hypothetical protein